MRDDEFDGDGDGSPVFGMNPPAWSLSASIFDTFVRLGWSW